MRATLSIVMLEDDPQTSEALAGALAPDKVPGVRTISRARGKHLEVRIQGEMRVETLISILEDVFVCYQASSKVLKTL